VEVEKGMKTKIVGILLVTLLIITALPAMGSMKIGKTEHIIFEPKTASTNKASWYDNFDSYAAGSSLHGQGGWEAWDNNPATTVYVTDDQSRSSPNSVDIAWFSGVSGDIVQQFTDVNSGTWIFSTWQYVPSSMTGISFLILMNTYTHGGTHNLEHWSTQIEVSATGGYIRDYDNPTETLPLITDDWINIYIAIDFDADIQTIYYDNVELTSKSWTAGVSPGGALNLACVDLYADANPSTSVYYDDFSLDLPQPLSCDANGPYEGLIGEDIEFDGTATGGIPPYEYLWDYGDGNTSSGDPHPTHNYANAGNYTVTLTVTDSEDNIATDTTWVVINSPPNAPTITGPNGGEPGTEYTFTFNAVDIDGDDVKFHIEWGDGTSDTTSFVASGTDEDASNIWAVKGTYTITAYAEDSYGQAGPETTKEVNMPRNKAVQTPLFLRFLQNHPNIFPILRQLIGL
jgi:hypothetical protein